MRNFIIIATGIGLGLSTAAVAQTKNTPEGIICAMTGSCDAPAPDGDRVQVGNEKAFSLSRPAASAGTPATTTSNRATAPARTRSMAAVRRPVAPARVRPGGGIDMQVTFPMGSAQMTPKAQAEARAFAQALSAPQMAGMRFAIEGHTDAVGARDKNMALSQARAQSVVDYLGSQGVDTSRLTAKGYGPDRPLRGTRATAPANRRVEFVKQG
jgi:outer membrane protein OmpA-like peptidoglycan-associated protein